jgi:putative addiction module killer protein
VIDIEQYIDRKSRNSFERWYYALEAGTRARVVIAIDRLRRGSAAAKGVGSGVMELRLDFGPGYRIYFGRDGATLVILLGGGTKKRQQADIEAAKLLWREYKERKKET